MNFNTFISEIKQLILPIGVSVVLGFAITSCSKKEEAPVAHTQTNEESQEEAIKELLRKLPDFELKMENGKSVRVSVTENKGFSFSNPPSETGYTFSESTGTYTYVEKSSANNAVVFAASGFGGNASGGIVSAGSNSYDLGYTFCLTADDQAFDLGLFDNSFTGVSMVVGVSGDFKELIEGNQSDADSANFEDVFSAFAYYIIYDDKASGNYKILNWLEDQEKDEDFLKNKGFAVIFDIKNSKIFFSKSGQLNVSGGSVSFSGTYLQIDAAFDEENDNLKYKEVSGAGAMGCN